MFLQYQFKSRDSLVGIALGYGLEDRGSRVRVPAGAGNFSLHHPVQNGSGAHPASYPLGTRGSFPRGKAVGAWSWPLTSNLMPRSKNEWTYTSTPPVCLHGMVLSKKKTKAIFIWISILLMMLSENCILNTECSWRVFYKHMHSQKMNRGLLIYKTCFNQENDHWLPQKI
jgi:hypothetical protein